MSFGIVAIFRCTQTFFDCGNGACNRVRPHAVRNRRPSPRLLTAKCFGAKAVPRKSIARLIVAWLAGASQMACGVASVGTGPDASTRGASVTLAFSPDVPLGGEAYVCFGFDVSAAVLAAGINAIEWDAPGGAVSLHHGKLYAVNAAYPSGPAPCDEQPTGAVPLHTWVPGGGPLLLPANVAVTLPGDAVSLVVEAHVYRFAAGEPTTDRVRLTLAGAGANVRAGWTARGASVPALRPGQLETSTDQCALSAPMHVYLAWPHEHLLGHSFNATVTGSGGVLTLVDVPAWNFARQVAVMVDADIATGDVLRLTCTWLNNTDHYVLPGPKTTDEMCGLGLIVSPPSAGALPCLPAN